MASASVPLVDCCLEEYRTALRRCLLDRKLFAMPAPKFNVLPEGELARIRRSQDEEEDSKEEGQIDDEEDQKESGQVNNVLTLQDIQAFIIALLLPEPRLSTPPKWCRVLRCMRASMVGIFLIDNADLCWLDEPIYKFNHVFKFKEAPGWIETLINVELSKRQQTKANSSVDNSDFKYNCYKTLVEKIPRTSLLLSPIQMIVEGFPIPGKAHDNILANPFWAKFDLLINVTHRSPQTKEFDDDVSLFRSHFKEVTNRSPMFAIDCEMCMTDAQRSELTRISVVDEECELVYDSFVKPPNRITDYLTKYSGITKEILDPVDTALEDVLNSLRKFLPRDAIICGHSLNNDLQALNVFHPYIIDTSIIYNLTGWRPSKPSLKGLAYTFLNREIQNNRKKGHDSIEDAMTAMELVKLKLANEINFGDQVVKDAEIGVKFDARSGVARMPINKFVGRHNTQLTFGEIDKSPGARFLYIHDDEQPVGDQIKDTIRELMEKKLAICVVLANTGLCYVKF